MTKLTKSWKSLNRFQKALIAVACLLGVLVAVSYIDFSGIRLPFPETIRHQEMELGEALDRLTRLERQRQEQQTELRELQIGVMPFLWRIGDKTPAAEIQTELERLARAEQITIRGMGSPRSGEVSEHVQKVEISINITGSMREIARFLAAVEQSKRRLYWHTCRLRPVQSQNLDSISLSGRLEAFFLTPGAERIIFKQE